MKLPEVIKVACFDVKIEDWKPISAAASSRFGEFSCLESLIRIDTSIDRIKVIDTLLHEICHAIYWAYGIEDGDKEERVVGFFATAWTQIYRDNPHLLEYIKHTLHKDEE